MQNKSFLNNLLKGISGRTSKLFANPYKKLNIGPVKLKYLKHLPAGTMRQHQMLNGTVHYTNPQELLHALDELFIDEIYKLNLPPQSYIIDCGANIGLSVIYLKRLYPDASILAFEPDPKNFQLLSTNIKSFQLSNVTLKQEAVWIEDTLISFASEGSMSSKIEVENGSGNQVKAIRLRNFLDRKVHFLKIDIEGAEYAVLKDIQDQLHNVDHLFLEYHGLFNQNRELIEMLDLVEKAHFSFYIKEATSVYDKPFADTRSGTRYNYDVQLNIFCFRHNQSQHR